MKPLLAATVKDVEQLEGRYPFYASPKLDGIRALVYKGQLVSRNLKPIRNAFIQEHFPLKEMEGFDGELIVGSPTAPDCFRVTTSGVMSADGSPDATFWIFDRVSADPFALRFEALKKLTAKLERWCGVKVPLLPHRKVCSAEELELYETACLKLGYEGVMLRAPTGLYKFGRSTLAEGHLMKLKRFEDSEAEVLEVIELQHNQNVKTTDALGNSKRSTRKEGKVAGGKMGALRVRDIYMGVEFDVGGGFTEYERNAYWKRRERAVGDIIKYKYFPTGGKEKPRFPVFLGARDIDDIS